jgi:phosphoribosylglycinamide formyltransferase-1
MNRLRLGILISGRGSNMRSLIAAARNEPDFPAEPVIVISNRPEAKGLEFALEQGVPAMAIDHKAFGKDREGFERVLDAGLRSAGVEMVALAGFMRVLTPHFVRAWQGRLINIHPSLLPKHKGLHTHRAALDAGDTEAGCTVHWVSEGVDEGDIIAQARVPVLPEDDEETLAARVLVEEHRLYPAAIRLACRAMRA